MTETSVLLSVHSPWLDTAHTLIMTDYYYQKLMDKTVLYNCTCMHKSWHCALKPKASNEWVERGTI